MQSEFKIEQRSKQTYIGTRKIVPMSEFDREIPAMTAKVGDWLRANDVRASGKPFIRYHVIDMPERMDVELGFPVADAPTQSGDLSANTLPAGRYAISTYKGAKNGIPANKSLIEWIEREGDATAHQRLPTGDAFEARYETFLTDSKTEPDPDKWDIEIAIKLRD